MKSAVSQFDRPFQSSWIPIRSLMLQNFRKHEIQFLNEVFFGFDVIDNADRQDFAVAYSSLVSILEDAWK